MHATASLAVMAAQPRAARASVRPARGDTIAASRPLGLRQAARIATRVPDRAELLRASAAATAMRGAEAGIMLASEHLASGDLNLPYADITLRAEADGATARAHRGVLALHSRVFAAAFAAGTSEECVLLRKTGADLRLLLGWLYRGENFAKVRPSSGACESISAKRC